MCANATPDISLNIACVDGVTFKVCISAGECVREVKVAIGKSRDMCPGLIELFVHGKEDALPNGGRLDALGVHDAETCFMLLRPGWCWRACGTGIALSENDLVATKLHRTVSTQLVTGGEAMVCGLNYWEVEITEAQAARAGGAGPGLFVGAVRPKCDSNSKEEKTARVAGLLTPFAGPVSSGLDHNRRYSNTDGGYYLSARDGSLFGSGQSGSHAQGAFAKGDVVGVLLDLDAGWLRFYRNGVRCGPGYAEGVTGPLVPAVEITTQGTAVTVVPGAAPPLGAGGDLDGWDSPDTSGGEEQEVELFYDVQ